MSLARLYTVDSATLMSQVQNFVRLAISLNAVQRVVLFGSMVRNQMTAASDIDLAVIVDPLSDVRELKEELRQFKRRTLKWPVDLLVCDSNWFESRKDFGGVCMAIDQDGVVLFDRDKGAMTNGT